MVTLGHQTAEVIAGANDTDPAVRRLLPDAYPDDAEASAEFRRYTHDDLTSRKVRNAHAIIAAAEAAKTDDGIITLDAETAGCWMRGLNDMRLILASRLGIESDDEDAGRGVDTMMRDVYDWLGFVQNSLVEALSG